MRIVFMGSPQFASDILEEVAAHYDVVAAYSAPDAVRARGKELSPTPVKTLAQRLNIPVETPKTLRDAEAVEALRAYAPDVICVAAYGLLLPKQVLEIPPLGCLNVHASLLPRWRGAAPVERAILAGDEEVGVCIMHMEEGLDTGSYCVRRSIPVFDMSAKRLTSELSNLGAKALITALQQLESGAAKWVEQPQTGITYANKIEKGELNLFPGLSPTQNIANVRASSDAHPAKCNLAGRSVRVLSVSPVSAEELSANDLCNYPLGSLVKSAGRLLAFCLGGAFAIDALKPDGKREMDAASFMAGIADFKAGFIDGGFTNA